MIHTFDTLRVMISVSNYSTFSFVSFKEWFVTGRSITNKYLERETIISQQAYNFVLMSFK